MGHTKRKSAFEYVQNMQFYIILCIRKVSPRTLVSIDTF